MSPRDRLFRNETRLEQRVTVEQPAEQRVDRHRSRHRRRGAPTLASAQRKAFPDAESDAPSAEIRAGGSNHRQPGQPRGMAVRVRWKIAMPGIEHSETGPLHPLCPHFVAEPRHRKAENVESGTDVADAAWSK